MTRIVAVRHGKTAWNEGELERFRGRADIELDEEGVRQAKATAIKLAQQKVTAVYSSPLKRALSTATILAEPFRLPVQPIEGLIDIDYGSWQGLTLAKAAVDNNGLYEAWLNNPHLVTFPQGESLEQVQRRAISALKSIAPLYPDQTVVLVSHKVVLKVLFCNLMGLGVSHFWQVQQDTCAINIAETRNGTFAVLSLNDTSHLQEVEPKIVEILHLLQQEYGVPNHQTENDPVSTLVATILSQNTSDTNSKRAFKSLITSFGSWERATTANTDKLATSIRLGGLADIKAKRIKLALQQIQQLRGQLDLGFLKELPLPEAKAWLRQLPGVGPKTAGCVLLFSLNKPALPVDTHVFRVTKRLGLINSNVSVEQAHELLEALIPPQYIYQFHLQTVEHGRRVCKAQRPHCNLCNLQRFCFSYSQQNIQERMGKIKNAAS